MLVGISNVGKSSIINALMKQYKNYTKVGNIIGISDNAVKKRFISLGYPNNIRDLILKL